MHERHNYSAERQFRVRPSGSRSNPAPRPPPKVDLDRTKTCPFLLRVFWKINQHHTLDSFDNASKLPEDQVQIYTWRDATLRELTELIQQVVPEAAEENVTLDFCAIYLSLKAGKANSRPLGRVSNKKGDDDNKTLLELRFEVGDFIDVSVQQKN